MANKKRKSLFAQLALPMLAIGLFSVIASAYTSILLKRSVTDMSSFTITSQRFIQRLDEVDKLLAEYRATSLKHMAAESAEAMRGHREYLDLYQKELETKVERIKHDHRMHDEGLTEADQLRHELKQYFATMTGVLALSTDFEKELAFEQFRNVEQGNYPRLQQGIEALRQHIYTEVDASREQLLGEARSNQIMNLSLGVGGGVLIIMVAFYFTQHITRRLNRILQWSNDFTRGRRMPLLADTAADELGELTLAINAMSAKTVDTMVQLEQAKFEAEQHTADLRDAEARLKNLNEDLERRVLVRTAELAQAKDDAERANRAKSEFLSRMSHELRTPMNAIMGFAQLLEIDDTLDAEQKDSVDEIRKASTHLLDLINEVLDLAKIESGKIDVSMEQVELRPLLREICTLIEPAASKRNITLHLEAENGRLLGDRTRLKQVLLNLLSNAVKYNRDNGSIAISTARSEGDRMRISITDTGPGIDAVRQQELFQPFNRLDAEYSDIEGTGIGLVICKSLIELMGGRIGVSSVPGQGSTFWIELQCDATDSVTGAAHATMPSPLAAPATCRDGPACAVLYIDDNPSNLRLVSQVLDRYPQVEVIAAQHVWEGIEQAIERRPRMILLDINMPEMNGYEVLSVLRGHECCREVPIIAVSAAAMDQDVARGLAAGFDDYLTKPLDIRSLMGLVERLGLRGEQE